MNGEQILLDEEVITKSTKDLLRIFSTNKTKYNAIPAHIIISNQVIDEHLLESDKSTVDKSDFNLFASDPRYSFDEVFLPNHSKKQLFTALAIEKHNDKLRKDWGLQSIIKDGRAIILNFFGSPGTGKSMTAEAIANYLGKRMIKVNYSELESKYVSETPKNIKSCFAEAAERDAILIFDEADSFLGKRLTNVNQSADYGVNVTRSTMLMELEKFSLRVNPVMTEF